MPRLYPIYKDFVSHDDSPHWFHVTDDYDLLYGTVNGWNVMGLEKDGERFRAGVWSMFDYKWHTFPIPDDVNLDLDKAADYMETLFKLGGLDHVIGDLFG